MLTEKITYNEKTVAGIGELSISGVSRDVVESTAFGDTVKKYVFSWVDGGTISFKGHYDPDDADGQVALQQALSRGTLIGKELKFFIDGVKYLSVSENGYLLIKKAKSLFFEKSGLGKTEFLAQVSGGVMDLDRKLEMFSSDLLALKDSMGATLYCY